MGKKIHKYTPAHTYTHNCDKYRMKNFGIKKKNFFLEKKIHSAHQRKKNLFFLLKKNCYTKSFADLIC